jgi:putative FmdB family regulatory protein
MPTYEYACRSCGEHLEVVQSFRDDPLTDCPACQGQLRKVFSAAGIIFKGSGWHVKDYASSSNKAASSSSGSSASSDGDTGAAAKSGDSGKDRSSSDSSSASTSSSSSTSEAASA